MANRVKIKETENCWVDNRGNRWDKQRFSKSKALSHSSDCVNSFNCYNCTNCSNCSKCVNCHDCKECTSCNGCMRCTSCKGCMQCRWAQSCTNCSKCESCNGCMRCKSCNDCNMCQSCKYCRNTYKQKHMFNNNEEVYNFFYETDSLQVVGAFGNDDGYYWDKEYHIVANNKNTYVFLVTGSQSGYRATVRSLKKCPLNFLEKRKKECSKYSNEVRIEDFKDDEAAFIHLYCFMNGMNAEEVQENEDTLFEYHYELNVIE